ncbi:MAG TPA: hypothetical protein VM347_28220 [Nonomuraea sp.]|nr:hypothetical protein [Nonomuraea sp.]
MASRLRGGLFALGTTAVLMLHRDGGSAPQPVPSRSTRAAEVVEEKRELHRAYPMLTRAIGAR